MLHFPNRDGHGLQYDDDATRKCRGLSNDDVCSSSKCNFGKTKNQCPQTTANGGGMGHGHMGTQIYDGPEFADLQNNENQQPADEEQDANSDAHPTEPLTVTDGHSTSAPKPQPPQTILKASTQNSPKSNQGNPTSNLKSKPGPSNSQPQTKTTNHAEYRYAGQSNSASRITSTNLSGQ